MSFTEAFAFQFSSCCFASCPLLSFIDSRSSSSASMISNLPSASLTATAGHAATKFLSCLCLVLMIESASLTSGGSGGELNHPPIVPSDVHPLPFMLRTRTPATFSSASCNTLFSASSLMRASINFLSFSAACLLGAWLTSTASLADHALLSLTARTRSTHPTPSRFQSASEPSNTSLSILTGMGLSIKHSLLIIREMEPSTCLASELMRSSQPIEEMSFFRTACKMFPYLSSPSSLLGFMSSTLQSSLAPSAELQLRNTRYRFLSFSQSSDLSAFFGVMPDASRSRGMTLSDFRAFSTSLCSIS
mmetsp:Transcript_42628/g.106647  ORF Transcript_42628/g.106647 Transcript_42628/m.106647 type:complete len:305 (+) Transcript_42628:2625-3539(+)